MRLVTLVVVLQGGGWTALPPHPTVGDTIWLERGVTLPPGWRLRPSKLELTGDVESLGDAALLRATDGWIVRYPIVAWSPGSHTLALPPLWRLAPDGHADSIPGGGAVVDVQAVIPDTLRHPEPQPALAPIRSARRQPLAPLAAVGLALGVLAAGVGWRRRRPRDLPTAGPAPPDPEVPPERWLAAGEPKAVAVRATYRVRAAIARALPEVPVSLSAAECVAVLARVRPDAPVRELADLLDQLDRVAFASAHGADVLVLARRAEALAREFAP